jgi:hypothetical protein
MGDPDKAELPGSRLLACLLAGESGADARRQGPVARRGGRRPRVVRQRFVGSRNGRARPIRRQDLEREQVAGGRGLAHLPGPVGRRRLPLLARQRQRRPVLHGPLGAHRRSVAVQRP